MHYLHANSFVALRDLFGLPVESKRPYLRGDFLSPSTLKFDPEVDILRLVGLVGAGLVIFFLIVIGIGAGLIGCSMYLRSKILE